MSDDETGYNKEWISHYQFLEMLRGTGVTNMYGATPYLEEHCDLKKGEAMKVLSSWMDNYNALIEDGVITKGGD